MKSFNFGPKGLKGLNYMGQNSNLLYLLFIRSVVDEIKSVLKTYCFFELTMET